MGIDLSSPFMAKVDAASLRGPMIALPATRPASLPVGGASKRSFDIVFSLLVILFFAPLLLFVALAVKTSDGGPILFRHKRIGRGGVPFHCLKFRTMRSGGDALLAKHLAADASAQREWRETRKLKNDPRVTAIGVFLRKTSLDELPQLFNILFGQMSVVGPRPIVNDEIAMYGTDAQHYLATRPGLTGAWQVSGRNDVSYGERVRLDRTYIENWSFTTDIVIVLRTVPAVFMSRGSY